MESFGTIGLKYDFGSRLRSDRRWKRDRPTLQRRLLLCLWLSWVFVDKCRLSASILNTLGFLREQKEYLSILFLSTSRESRVHTGWVQTRDSNGFVLKLREKPMPAGCMSDATTSIKDIFATPLLISSMISWEFDRRRFGGKERSLVPQTLGKCL